MTRAYAAFHRFAPGITPTCYLAGLWLLVSVSACAPQAERRPDVDLLTTLEGAEKRAGGNPDVAIRMELAGPDGDLRPSLTLRAPARVTWTLYLPEHSRWQSALWGSGRLRVGLSNGRSYHELARRTATERWDELDVDLREYSEWKLSVFYQPLRTEWRLIINADALTPDGESRLALDRPRLISAPR